MAAVRALLNLHCSALHTIGLLPVQLTSTCLLRRLCNDPKPAEHLEKKPAEHLEKKSAEHLEKKPAEHLEKKCLLENLKLMGVDVKSAQQRQPEVFRRKVVTNEHGLAKFLHHKGADHKVIGSIITRYPRAIIRTAEHLEQRWQLWRLIFESDAEIVSILARSPESFFRSSDNENLEKNIVFLTSLGLSSKHLHRLLKTSPRTFSNTFELNRQMVELLEEVCREHGGEHPEQFVKHIISRNPYILHRSIKRIKRNVDFLKTSLMLSDKGLLTLLRGDGAHIVALSDEYLEKNFKSLQQKMDSLGCQRPEAVKQLVLSYPMVLYFKQERLNTKLDCLLKGGITIDQILEKPRVLDFSTQNITGRLTELQKVGYNFEKSAITILELSQKRFDAKMGKLYDVM